MRNQVVVLGYSGFAVATAVAALSFHSHVVKATGRGRKWRGRVRVRGRLGLHSAHALVMWRYRQSMSTTWQRRSELGHHDSDIVCTSEMEPDQSD
jgi:hypothetical protein